MTKLERVCRIEEVPRGTVRRFKVAGKDILIAHATNGYYAMDTICSHRNGDLSKGRLEDKIIYCPVHGSGFNVTNGKVVKNVSPVIKTVTRRAATDLRSYPVRVDAGVVWVEI